ncbi:MAG: hypothetical protein ACK5IM_08320 [Demequina sp.]|uniref:hypothetical protein n=1 Tax=Demequina sp. TaxID=2050685 RepID=UPI003A88E9D0
MDDSLSLASLIVAILVGIWSIVSFCILRHQRKQTEEREHMERAQEIDVYWAHDMLDRGTPYAFGLVISNRTRPAVKRLVVHAIAPDNEPRVEIETVPPGDWRLRHFPGEAKSHGTLSYAKPAEPGRWSLSDNRDFSVPEYEFVDVRGHRWRRGPEGLRRGTQ